MKTIITILALAASITVYSQEAPITLRTDDGRKVLLQPDGTWSFIEEGGTMPSDDGESSLWETKYYVDNFGDKTDKKYQVFIDEKGKFSNSATSGSELFARTLIDDTNIRFDLFEYGRGQSVGKALGSARYTLSVKSDNETLTYSLVAYEKALALEKKDRNRFLSMLKDAGDELKCFLEIRGEYSSSTYNFKLAPLK